MAEFVEDVCRNYSEIRIGRNRRNNATYMLLELHDEKHKRTLYVELSHDGTYWNVNSGGIFKRSYTDKNDIAWPEPTVGSSANTNTTEVRRAVATFELVFFSPTLDRIAVNAANTAESIAINIHITNFLNESFFPCQR